MMIFEKEAFCDKIRWLIKESDGHQSSWKVIGMTEFGIDRITAILLGLKDFPVEIRER
jgi:hypothetical protein